MVSLQLDAVAELQKQLKRFEPSDSAEQVVAPWENPLK